MLTKKEAQCADEIISTAKLIGVTDASGEPLNHACIVAHRAGGKTLLLPNFAVAGPVPNITPQNHLITGREWDYCPAQYNVRSISEYTSIELLGDVIVITETTKLKVAYPELCHIASNN